MITIHGLITWSKYQPDRTNWIIWQNIYKNVLKKRWKLTLNANNNTLQCELFCNRPVDFSKPNTVGPLLGFRNDKVLEPNETHESHLPANILKVNVIRIECNITTGSYLNNQPSHTIHEFSPKVPPDIRLSKFHITSFTIPSLWRIYRGLISA